MQFWSPDDEHMCSKHVETWNKFIERQNILCIKLVNYRDKYTEMHGQQNLKRMYEHGCLQNSLTYLSMILQLHLFYSSL